MRVLLEYDFPDNTELLDLEIVQELESPYCGELVHWEVIRDEMESKQKEEL